MGQIFYSIQEFIFGGSIIYHSFTLCPKIGHQNKIAIFWKCNGKWVFIHYPLPLPFLKDSADKLRPHSQISFKSL